MQIIRYNTNSIFGGKKMVKNTRKRGEELENEIYAASLEILENEGMEEVTFANIARKAQTSRTVLYRRWAKPFDILFEATMKINRGNRGSIFEEMVDSGSMREDLRQIFNHFLRTSQVMGREVISEMTIEKARGNEYLEEAMAKAREGNIALIDRVFEYATNRGEAVAEISTYAKVAPFELIRYEMMINNHEITPDFVDHLIDEIVLPIYIGKN
jgi:AcrR family transcriptional regulator